MNSRPVKVVEEATVVEVRFSPRQCTKCTESTRQRQQPADLLAATRGSSRYYQECVYSVASAVGGEASTRTVDLVRLST